MSAPGKPPHPADQIERARQLLFRGIRFEGTTLVFEPAAAEIRLSETGWREAMSLSRVYQQGKAVELGSELPSVIRVPNVKQDDRRQLKRAFSLLLLAHGTREVLDFLDR